MDDKDDLESEALEVPKTAHALLKEGSTDCLALSRRGLFTAGKVSGEVLMILVDQMNNYYRVEWCNALT